MEREQRRATIAKWFEQHTATYHAADVGSVKVERLTWKRTGSSFDRIDYVCIGGATLCVYGDHGEAVYNAGARDLAWWAGCNLDYFARKCQASEFGRGFKDWEEDEAKARFEEEVARMKEEGATFDEEREELVTSGSGAIEDGREEWHAWMREHGHELFGDDWWEFVPNFGVGVALRCESQLIGLQMAIAALTTPTARSA
jgi:hypothetical protein